MSQAIADRIEIAAGVCGGKPHVVGTRIRVQDIVAWHEVHGRSPDEIASGYPQLSLADIHAALAYYHANRDEILGDMKADEQFVADFKAAYLRKGVRESAGINRLEIGNERVLQRRPSPSRWPRSARGSPSSV